MFLVILSVFILILTIVLIFELGIKFKLHYTERKLNKRGIYYTDYSGWYNHGMVIDDEGQVKSVKTRSLGWYCYLLTH